MKKAFWILIGFCILFAVSCKTTNTGVAATAVEIGNLGSFRLVLDDNFQWSDDYQAKVNHRNLMGGHQIQPGETYTLRITYSASRDLEQALLVAFVDTTPAVNWWKPLSFSEEDGVDGLVEIPASKEGEVVTAEITLRTVKAASDNSAVANGLVFWTKGEGVKGKPGSGVKRPVMLTITEFVLTRVEE